VRGGWRTGRRHGRANPTRANRDLVNRSMIGDASSQPRTGSMANISEIAEKFFVACEAGKGWEGCKAYCVPEATFSAQAEPLADVNTLEAYCNWMKGILGPLPDGRYDLKSFAVDTKRNNVAAYAVFHATHTGQGGPVPATGKKTATDYVYVMQFTGDKISHMTKVWHSGLCVKELGWA
jgi:predicted ester cyclase